MAKKFIIGVMGPGEGATPDDNEIAFRLGEAIAEEGWIVLTGGREFGVMDSVMKGACEHDGLTIGILPMDSEKGSSRHASIKIVTGMGSARNLINVLSSHVIVVVGMAAGTASEVALAIKADKRVILLNQDELTIQFFKKIGSYKVKVASSVEEVIGHVKECFSVNV